MRTYRLGLNPRGRIESPDDVLLTEMQTPGSRVFHSTYMVDLQRTADLGVEYSCLQCGEAHSVTRAPTTVILTESEQVATYQSPVNCTLAEDTKPSLPRAGPDVHSDVLLVPCGLQSNPLSFLEAVYGLHKGRLNLVVDMGTEAIKRGES